ncbi:LIP2 [Mytilus edulis]|uniref:Octanoyl-[acyl-carrier-protein]:protein N-octanoyltransferase LIPT2, mitochondrial n=1 Tax=Mytilus edulis TaxID=6550 RepID=A0A8S3VB12_MYTED|nr:LIP2 [Mytilus edulis]
MMSSYSKIVSVLNLGRMGFLDAYKVQTKFARQHLDSMAGVHGSKGENVVLLVEHNPVYTIGIRSKDYSEEYEQKLKKLGQLVAYPILNLKYFTPNMKWYICSMEKTMIGTCKHYGLNAHSTEDTGVWIGDRKIGAIGVHGRRYVTTHGVSLNCNTDLNWFKHIVPCGLKGKDVTLLVKKRAVILI